MLYPGGKLDRVHICTYNSNHFKKQHHFQVPRTLAHVRVHLGKNFSQDLDSTSADKINKSVSVNKLPTEPVLRGGFCTLTQALWYHEMAHCWQWEEARGGRTAQILTECTSSDRHLHTHVLPGSAAQVSHPPSLWQPAPQILPEGTICW